MKKFLKLFFVLISARTKFEIFLPKKCDILCYDQGKRFNQTIKKIFSTLKIDVLYVRFEKLNLIIFFKSIFSKIFDNNLSFKNHYIKNYCNYSNPKIIISTSYLDRSFLYLKKIINKNCKIILIQRCPYRYSDFNIKKNKPIIDQTYVFNEKSLKIIKNNIISKVFILGSFRNNEQKKNKKKDNSILIISGYKKNFENLNINDDKKYHYNLIHEIKIIRKIIKKLCKKYKIKILLKPDVKKKDYLEFSNFHKKYVIANDGNPYKFIDQSNLVITFTTTTINQEAISRKVKNVQIPRKKIKNLNKFYIYNDSFDETKIKNFLLKILRMDHKSYFDKVKEFQEDIVIFNQKNILLKKNIYKLLNLR